MVSKQRGGTPAIVELQQAGVAFTVSEFEHQPGSKNYGLAAAEALGRDPGQVFKTLLTLVDDQPVVAIIPVDHQLSLKLLSAAVDGKRAVMMPGPAAERLTGYVVGGISPFGQKRRSTTVLDESALLFDTILVSGGRRGLDIELSPFDLCTVLAAEMHAVIVAR